MDIALVTYRDLPALFPDDQPLAAALAAAGLDVGIVRWDDPRFDWASTRVALLRSPWDYFHRPAEFLAWAERAASATRLVNPLPMVRWNLHKAYLVELAARGVPVVPTAVVPRSARHETGGYARLLADRGWTDAVVKPAVSADSWETIFVRGSEAERGEAHLARHVPERDMLVQPFLPSVESHGERCLVFLEGRFSHAVRKNALTLGGRWTDLPEGAPVEAEADEVAAAERVLEAAFEAIGASGGCGRSDALYARVDLTRDASGEPLLLELELTEPTLFLAAEPAALARLVTALVRLAGTPALPPSPDPSRTNCE